jgi:fructose-1,6-bisphosphatase II
MRGVRFFGNGIRTSSLLMSLSERHIRFIDTVHVDRARTVVVVEF